jgi:hypothetical protein
MRNKILTGSMALLVILDLGFILFCLRKLKDNDSGAYDAQIAGYKKEIEMLNSRETLKSILMDSLPKWREEDKRAIIRELEDIQDNIEYYGDVQTASPQKVDKMYQKAIKELVDKYKNGELQP